MMKPHRRKRLGVVLFIAFGMSVAVALTLFALSQNINMFYSPTQVANGEVEAGTMFRIGGVSGQGNARSETPAGKLCR